MTSLSELWPDFGAKAPAGGYSAGGVCNTGTAATRDPVCDLYTTGYSDADVMDMYTPADLGASTSSDVAVPGVEARSRLLPGGSQSRSFSYSAAPYGAPAPPPYAPPPASASNDDKPWADDYRPVQQRRRPKEAAQPQPSVDDEDEDYGAVALRDAVARQPWLVDIAVYVLSGVLLIFLLEAFIKLGANMQGRY